MQEIIEQAIDYLKGIWIKRRFIIISTWLICPLAWLYISQMDDVYESKARVHVDTQSLLRPLLRGLTVENNPETQIRLMVQTLLSRQNLERIARMTDLDIQAETPEQFEQLIANLKEDIKIERSRGNNIFSISTEHSDPIIARNIVQSTLDVFIENTLGESRNDSDDAQKFLDDQIREYEERLLTDESKLTNFKQKYSEILPNKDGGYYRNLNDSRQRLEATQLQLTEIETKIASANSALEESRKQVKSGSDKVQDGTNIRTDYDDRISQIETNLDDLLLKYTEKHPDVVETQRLLKSLQDSRQKELDNYYAAISDSESDTSIGALSSNPVYQDIQIRVNSLNNEAASLRVRIKSFQDKINEYEQKIHLIPEIEAELTALNRGYNITKQKYEQLLVRKETARLAQQAEESTSKINFRIIDPAAVPNKPTGPMRNVFAVAATILGIGVGVGLSLLFSQINPVVTSSSQVSKATGIPVFGAVSAAENLGLQKWYKKKTIIFICSNAFLLFMMACFIFYFTFPDLIREPLSRFM